MAKKRGKETPVLDAKPELYADLIPIWNAFNELSAGRHVGMGGVSGLAASDVAAWLDLAGIEDLETRALWWRLIRAMDEVVLKHSRKK